LPRLGRALAPAVMAHIRGGIFTLRQAVPCEAREAAVDVVSRIHMLSKN